MSACTGKQQVTILESETVATTLPWQQGSHAATVADWYDTNTKGK